MQSKTLMIIHIPKCAGTTLRTILERQYPLADIYKIKSDIRGDQIKLRSMDAIFKRTIRAVFGHYHYGLHEALAPGQPYDYITVLRDPVLRVVSLYSYTRTESPAHYLAKAARKMDLHEFVTSGVTEQIDNGMVRQLCGMDRFKMTVERKPRQTPYDDCEIPFRGVTREHLEAAKRNLDTFALVGFVEHFDRFLARMQARFSWRIPAFRHQNVSRERVTPNAREIKAITELNQFDFELYNWAMKREG